MSSIRRRLLAGLSANAFSRILTSLFQILSVPIFLIHWGSGLYGEWILLNAIPSYFTLSDIGFGTVAGNEMTMLVAAENQPAALEVFQSVWILTTAISSICGLLLMLGIWFMPLNKWLHVNILSPAEVRIIILLLGLSVLLSMQEILFQAAFRCVGKYAFGTVSKSLVSLAGFAAITVAVMFNCSSTTVASAYLLINGLGTFILWLLLKHHIPWIRFGVSHATWSTIHRLRSPAIAFMGFPLGNALTLQAPLIIIGSVLGPLPVVIFSTARTICRTINQLMQLVCNAVWPEMSAAFGANNVDLARRLHRRACQVSLYLCLSATLAVACFGSTIWRIWTIDKISIDPVMLDITLVQMLVSSLWLTSLVVPAAINQHQGTAKLYLVSSLLSLLFLYTLLKASIIGLRGAAAVMILGDLLMAAYVLPTSLRLTGDRMSDFLKAIFSLPRLRNRLSADPPLNPTFQHENETA